MPRKPALHPLKRPTASVRMTDAAYRALQTEAEMRQVPVSAVIRWAIDDYLKARLGPTREAV